MSETARAGKDAQLSDACLVVDALGEDAKYVSLFWPPVPYSTSPLHRSALLKWYSLLLLRDYRRLFGGAASEAGQLDNISRRFAWFRRVLKTHEEENGGIFPQAWNVGAVLAGGFAEVTKFVFPLSHLDEEVLTVCRTETTSRAFYRSRRRLSTSVCCSNR